MRSVFPWSMSDFKPGDYNLRVFMTILAIILVKVIIMSYRFFTMPVLQGLRVFIMGVQETPGIVER